MDKWKWKITSHYNHTVKHPKVPGTLVLQTVHADDFSKQVEMEAYAKRHDVNVTVVRLPDE